MIKIDGAKYEGGGQILRTAVALSAVYRKPCHIFSIRRNRPKPGLAAQHLWGIRALAQFCNGKLKGDYLGSEEIKFYPGTIYREQISIKIPTAGSITLALQALILPALFAPKPIKIIFKGGATDTFFSPTINYFRYVFLKILEKVGVKININIIRRGFYPEGGARVEAVVNPTKLKPLSLLERRQLRKIIIISGASDNLKENRVAERQISGVKTVLSPKLKLPITEKVEYYPCPSSGSQINIIGEFENTVIGVDNLGKLGKSAEIVGREAAVEFLKEGKSEGCLDKHLADQILPYLSLAPGNSQVKVSQITDHCKTNIWVIEKFLRGRFKIEDNIISWLPETTS